jgi:hypothetical protein
MPSAAFSAATRGAEDALLRRLNIVGLDLQRGPVTDASVLPGSDSDDAELWMRFEYRVANQRPLSWFIQSYYEQVGQGLIYAILNLCLIGNFTDDFDVWLLCERRKNHLTHDFGLVSHENANQPVHDHLLVPASIYGSYRKGRLKKELLAGLGKDYCTAPNNLN